MEQHSVTIMCMLEHLIVQIIADSAIDAPSLQFRVSEPLAVSLWLQMMMIIRSVVNCSARYVHLRTTPVSTELDQRLDSLAGRRASTSAFRIIPWTRPDAATPDDLELLLVFAPAIAALSLESIGFTIGCTNKAVSTESRDRSRAHLGHRSLISSPLVTVRVFLD